MENSSHLITDNDLLVFRKKIGIWVAIGLFVAFAFMLKSIMSPIFLGVILAIAFSSLSVRISKIKRFKLSDSVISALITWLIVGVFFAAITMTIYLGITQSSDVVSKMDGVQLSGIQVVIIDKISFVSKEFPAYNDYFEKAKEIVKSPQVIIHSTKGFGKLATSTISGFLGFIWNTFGFIGYIGFQFICVLIVMQQLLANRSVLEENIPNWLPIHPNKHEAALDSFGGTIDVLSKSMAFNGALQGFSGAILVNCYLAYTADLSLFLYIGMYLLFYLCSFVGFPIPAFAVALCGLFGFFEIHPIVGIVFVALGFGVGLLDNWTKKIFGDRLGLGFLYMTISMGLGGLTFGLEGAFIGPCLLIAICRIMKYANKVFADNAVSVSLSPVSA